MSSCCSSDKLGPGHHAMTASSTEISHHNLTDQDVKFICVRQNDPGIVSVVCIGGPRRCPGCGTGAAGYDDDNESLVRCSYVACFSPRASLATAPVAVPTVHDPVPRRDASGARAQGTSLNPVVLLFVPLFCSICCSTSLYRSYELGIGHIR